MYYIGYDLGSSSIKIALVDAETQEFIDIVSQPEGEMSILSVQAGWAEQNPEKWWEHLCTGTQKILKKNNLDPQKILAVGISYQMHGLVVLDKNRKLLRDSIIWCDSRAVSIGEKAAQELGEKRYGSHLLNAPGNFTASKLKWVKEHEAELYDQIAHYMLPGDYIAFKFTGEIATTKNGLSEGMLWDFKEKKVANWLLDYYGIDQSLTPPIVENFENQGTVNQQASEQTGLPKGIPIRYRAGDQPNNAWTLNILKPGEVAATGGTSGVLFAVSDREVSQEFHRVNHFAHVNYTNAQPIVGTLLCINGAGIQYSWLKKITGLQNFQAMNVHAKSVPIGSQGLINLPFGNGAERMFNNETVGAHFSNLNLNVHLQGHLCRSVLEGVAFSFAYGMEIMRKDALHIQVIRAGNDNLFRSQIFSDTVASLIGQPIEIFNTTGAVGAARAAGIKNRSFDQYSSSMTEKDRLEVVLPKKNEAYQTAYESWKRELNKQLNNQNTTQ